MLQISTYVLTVHIQDINRIEGLVSIVALFAKHADSKEVAQAGDAEEKLERSLKIMYDILKIPPVFMKEDYAICKRSYRRPCIEDPAETCCPASEDAQKQSFWLAGSTSVLQLLHGLFKLDGVLAFIVLELNREARTVISLSKYTTAPLSSNTSDEQYLDPWTTPLSNKLALEMLSQLASQHSEGSDVSASQHRIKLSKHILLSYIKPLFTTTPHPLLNPETGRKLDRRRGGDLFGDSYIDGDWKGQSLHAEETGAVGCWKTYLYVLSMIEVSDCLVMHISYVNCPEQN